MNPVRALPCMLLLVTPLQAYSAWDLPADTKVEVLEIKRTAGDTVTLRFVISNPTQETFSVRVALGINDIRNVALLDFVNRKRFGVLRTNEACVCSRGSDEYWRLKPGARLELWGRYPAPAPTVTKLTVEVPGLPLIEDIAVTK